jgi:mannose-6-phosphate isomerase-like protein (cupin superfamily)
MNIRNLDRAHLRHENGLEAQRLCPWPVLNAPFEGSWCVVRPGVASTPDCHHDYEMWIAMSGEATVDVDGAEAPFVRGDVLYLPPNVPHRVINRGDRDFEMYSVWWDPNLAERFTSRHREAATEPVAAGPGRPG